MASSRKRQHRRSPRVEEAFGKDKFLNRDHLSTGTVVRTYRPPSDRQQLCPQAPERHSESVDQSSPQRKQHRRTVVEDIGTDRYRFDRCPRRFEHRCRSWRHQSEQRPWYLSILESSALFLKLSFRIVAFNEDFRLCHRLIDVNFQPQFCALRDLCLFSVPI